VSALRKTPGDVSVQRTTYLMATAYDVLRIRAVAGADFIGGAMLASMIREETI
jgi:hypothetical protein